MEIIGLVLGLTERRVLAHVCLAYNLGRLTMAVGRPQHNGRSARWPAPLAAI